MIRIRLQVLRFVKWLILGCDIGDSRWWDRLWVRVCQQVLEDIETIHCGKAEGAW